jgi:formate hydrogenlyase subunit 3/multisubunit Na+/H+ antiporter MnhD subunit
LIGFFREKPFVLKADKAFLVTVAGALAMLAGFFLIFAQTGTFDLAQMKGVAIPDLAVLLILFGILTKSATLPFHTWLPDAGVAPSPVTSLLHAAVLVKIGVYAFARLFLATFDISAVWHVAVPVVAAVSALVSAGAATLEHDLKRIVAYSTISQIGFILLGLSTGSAVGAAGGLLYILMHGLAKAGLFLCAGNIEQNTGTRDLRKLGGLAKAMPVTAAAFLLCSFSVMGIPPFGGFFSKFMVITGAVDAGQPWTALVFVLGAVMTVVYLLRAFVSIFMGEAKSEAKGEGTPGMVASVASLAAFSLLGGVLISYPAAVVDRIVAGMGGLVR